MPQASTAMSQPQAIAPAPSQNRMPQQLRPMPPNGLQHMSGMQSPYGQGTMMLQDMEPPTHVVGSQGRRGILPSAPGRPPPQPSGTGAKNTLIPAKDADGKFPCPHCTKTYLHAKHLKRHLLRHTGDRPYIDILKRHFQKCSIRRGNPTGASHLSHAQAHLKKSHPGPHKPTGSMSSNGDLMGVNGMNNNGMGNNGMNNMGQDPNLHPFGVIPDGSVPDASSNLTDEQAEHLSRSNSMKRLSAGGGGDRRNMTGPGPGGSGRGSFDQNYAGGIASTMPNGMNPSLAYMSNGQNGHSYSQGYEFSSHGNGMQPQSNVDMSYLQSSRNVYQSTTAGAVYSERLAPSQVRDMMEFSKAVIERNSTLLRSLSQDHSGDSSSSYKTDLEQLTALHMMQVLFTWHGTPVQREGARRQFPSIVALTRKLGLTTPVTTGSFSAYHQRHIKSETHTAAEFNWNAWVEQEKRSRLMYAIYLTDAAMVLYFNSSPLFEALEIRIPLPADDAAWDARSAAHCAEALGLNGPVPARERNPAGSRRLKQPEMHSALETLMRNDIDLQAGTTNLYSKFVLIHALHVQLWNAQKQMSQEGGNSQNPAFPGSGSSTPLTQNDWVVRGVDGVPSATSSGRATPVDGGKSQQMLKATNSAFDKWKKVWDEDMAVQYPPSSTSYRRFGFCRDGVHFFWLGKYLMKNNRGNEWQIAPDQRFTQVMHLLRYVQSFVASDSAERGEEPGSVNDVDQEFGVRDLTLDMSQLFKPINKQIDSPVMGVHTGSG
ncbi:putative Zinc finger protein [Glarea lozoyensis 74030]|uniref:Putative Zinc finger protein n=1 Tax=Glarea lozoyensis (strain ATCC 74030 / MF5533) TaxID=1104152 RepID=H0EFI8_GLAL7|nr:putative Zinc finger protein [Glarea lozoyensis 74030]